MYVPEAFRLTDLAACHAVIDTNAFGELVTVDAEGGPTVAHLPFILDRARGPQGTLVAHVADANPQAQQLALSPQVLVVFHGAHTYVSPAWYETQPAVPTWNYLAVHAYGRARVLSSEAAVRDALRTLVARSEQAVGGAWSVDRLSDDYLSAMAGKIRAFEVAIERIEGKAKLSQNRSPADRAGVISALERSTDPSALAIARAMRTLPSSHSE